jgi:hypothetical protein
MNPLAAALLAAQGWDVSRLRKQGGESSVSHLHLDVVSN